MITGVVLVRSSHPHDRKVTMVEVAVVVMRLQIRGDSTLGPTRSTGCFVCVFATRFLVQDTGGEHRCCGRYYSVPCNLVVLRRRH